MIVFFLKNSIFYRIFSSKWSVVVFKSAKSYTVHANGKFSQKNNRHWWQFAKFKFIKFNIESSMMSDEIYNNNNNNKKQ
jgi:hypothetical protein